MPRSRADHRQLAEELIGQADFQLPHFFPPLSPSRGCFN
jgi:hypothetical protein